MQDLIAEVVEARYWATVREDWKRDSLATWAEENRGNLAFLAEAQERRAKAEAALREAAVDIYNLTGNKHPAPGVEVKVRTGLRYDLAEALAWAKETGIALQLNAPVFEKLAKASPPPDFVEVVKVPFAAIAADLKAE